MKWKISISVLWLVFAVLFFVLALLHFAESKKTIPEFKMTSIPSSMDIKFGKASLREILGGFAYDFNKHLANQDESNRKANLYACYGYLLAGATALVSMVLVWQGYIFALLAKLVLLVKSQKTSKNNK